MANVKRWRCTHCRRWPSCWPHRSCSRKVQYRGCPGWASTRDAAWHRCNTGRALGSTLTVITPHFWYWLHSCTIGNHRTGVLTCPDRPRGCRSLRNRSSSRSRHSPRLASYRASHTGSFFWTGWGPGSPATGLKGRKQLESQTLSKGRFPNVGRFPHRQKDSQPRGTQSGEYSSFSTSRGSAHLNIFLYQVWDFGTALSAIHTTRRHTHSKVHTYSPWTHLNLGFWFCVDYSGLEEHQGRKHNIKKWPWT